MFDHPPYSGIKFWLHWLVWRFLFLINPRGYNTLERTRALREIQQICEEIQKLKIPQDERTTFDNHLRSIGLLVFGWVGEFDPQAPIKIKLTWLPTGHHPSTVKVSVFRLDRRATLRVYLNQGEADAHWYASTSEGFGSSTTSVSVKDHNATLALETVFPADLRNT